MRLSAPRLPVFLLSLVIAGLVIAVRFGGYNVPFVSGHLFESLIAAYVILLAGNVMKGL